MTKHITSADCSAERTSDGAWAVSALIGGHLRRIRYYGFSKRQAIRAFVIETDPRFNS